MFGGDQEQSLRVVRTGAEHPADRPVRTNLLFLHILSHFAELPISEVETSYAIAELHASPMPTMRAGGWWLAAIRAAASDPATAISHYQRAIDIVDNRGRLAAMCGAMQLELIARSTDVETALAGFEGVVDTWRASRGDVYTTQGLTAVMNWLARLGYSDDAAHLLGVITIGSAERIPHQTAEVLALPDVLGEARFAAAIAAGAALDPRAVAELASRALANVRRDLVAT
jgi:hypothetical protein